MPARSRARKRALDVLFEADLRGADAITRLAAHEEGRVRDQQPPLHPYVTQVVEGVVAHRARIDELIAEHAQGWTIERMPAVDRNLLRIGVYELLWADDVPDGVVLSEAVELATSLSTDESAGFVNGLLARIAELKPGLAESAPDPAAAG